MMLSDVKTPKKLEYPLFVSKEDLEAFEKDTPIPGISEALQRAGLVKIREAGRV